MRTRGPTWQDGPGLRRLEDGEEVRVGNQTLDVLHCPGHTPGHVVFFHRDSGLALVGDVNEGVGHHYWECPVQCWQTKRHTL